VPAANSFAPSPARCCFNIPMIFSSVYRLRFIAPPHQGTGSTSNRGHFLGRSASAIKFMNQPVC
jgi:hypothetical protein